MDPTYPVVLLALLAGCREQIQVITHELETKRITLDEWKAEITQVLMRYSAAAMMLGMETETLTEQAQQIVTQRVADQLVYLSGFADDIEAGLGDEVTGGAWLAKWNARAQLYSDSIQVPFWLGSLTRSKNWQWHYHPLAKHCTDCFELNDQVHTADWWRHNHMPGDGNTECEGGCRCWLTPVQE